MKTYIKAVVTVVVILVFFYACKEDVPISIETSQQDNILEKHNQEDTVIVTVFATGLNGPRGIKFGPDGYLYVSEAGLGGNNTSTDLCDQVIPPVGPYVGGTTARILKISRRGVVQIVADNLPSTEASIGDRDGVGDIEFVGHKLYALIAGGGCSHGNPDNPNSVIKINSNGTYTMIANLSEWQQEHPTAVIDEEDFEPDGTWYSMINIDGSLYAIEPNHGEMVKINPNNGHIKRVIDFTAIFGHVVPTSMDFHKDFYVGNLGIFPLIQGSSNIYKVSKKGKASVYATGFTAVLGVAFDKEDNLYVLEASSVDGFPTPGTGRVIRIDHHGNRKVLLDTLFFPTAMTFGPDGALYISNKGFGPPIPGFGEILKVKFKKDHDCDDDKIADNEL